MPIRVLLGDALRYRLFLRELRKGHLDADKRKVGLEGGHEFLSGIQKGERIAPVLTMVLYTGAEPWDGPRDLIGMLGSVDPVLRPWLNNWKVPVVQMRHDTGLVFGRDDNRVLFEAGRVMGGDGTRSEKVIRVVGLAEPFADAPGVLGAMTAVTGVRGVAGLVKEAREGKDMEAFVEQWARDLFPEAVREGEARGMAEGEARGKAEGIIQFARSIDADPAYVRDKLVEFMHVDAEEADRYVEAYDAGELNPRNRKQ